MDIFVVSVEKRAAIRQPSLNDYIRYCLQLLFVSLLGSTGDFVTAMEPVVRPMEQEVIVDVKLDRYVIYNGLLAFQAEDGLWLPLTEFIAALDFPIEVKLEDYYAQGWFIRESNTFLLDVKQQTVTLNGKKDSLSGGVEYQADDFYVRLDMLNRWFPLGMTYEPSRLIVEINPEKPLPLQTALKRKKSWSKLKSYSGENGQDYTALELPYQAVDWPFVDVSLGADYQHPGDEQQPDSYSWRSRFNFSGDFLWATAHMSWLVDKADNEINQDGYLWFERPLQTHSQLPLHVKAGDLYAPGFQGASASLPGTGFSLTNIPEELPTLFSTFSLQGQANPQWDVELYQNNELIDVQQISDDGRYQFNDVPLLYGNNRYRIMLYGPQGQVRERIVNRKVGSDWFNPGQWLYRFHWQKDNTQLLFSNLDDEQQSRQRYSLFLQYGLNRSAVWRGQWLRLGKHDYWSNSLVFSSLGGLFTLSSVLDQQGGSQWNSHWESRLGNQTVAWEWLQTDHLLSMDDDTETGEKEEVFSFRFGGTLVAWKGKRISQQIQFGYTQKGAVSQEAASQRLSLATPKWSLTNRLQWNKKEEVFKGSLIGRYRIQKINISNEINYTDGVLDKVAFTARYSKGQHWSLQARSNWDLDAERKGHSQQISFNYRRENMLWSFNVRHDKGDWSVGLEWSTALVRSPLGGNWGLHADAQTAQGGLAFQAYLDENANQIFDDNDQLLDHVGVTINREQVRSREDGTGLATQLPGFQWTEIEIEEKGLDDPYWLPARNHLKVFSRPGKVTQVILPIVQSGEIDGTCWYQTAEKTSALGSVIVELYDHSHKRVRQTKTTYDGFYLFDRLPPGLYYVKLEATQLQRLNLPKSAIDTAKEVLLSGNGDVRSGVDFTIRR